MKGSLLIVAFFLAGLLLGCGGLLPEWLSQNDYTVYALYLLMFLVGMRIGCDGKVKAILQNIRWRMLLVPLATIVGTLAGSALISLALARLSVADCLAIGSGFGYYSLSSVFITQYKGAELGAVALTANIVREILTLVGAPLMVRCFGRLAPICAGGATTMDTTLPIIARYSGEKWVAVAVMHGVVVDFTVPFFVTFFCSI